MSPHMFTVAVTFACDKINKVHIFNKFAHNNYVFSPVKIIPLCGGFYLFHTYLCVCLNKDNIYFMNKAKIK